VLHSVILALIEENQRLAHRRRTSAEVASVSVGFHHRQIYIVAGASPESVKG